MLGSNDLKSEFSMTEMDLECPVKGCKTVVRRRTRGNEQPESMYCCEKCKIVVYPSTFKHIDEAENLLWTVKDDIELLNDIKRYKAEKHRLGHDNSEDAVSWNVFHHFDRSGQLSSLVAHLTERDDSQKCEVIYWSYRQRSGAPWQPLVDARLEFGEARTQQMALFGENKVSEPDIILLTDDDLIFVEAKFGSGNKTPAKLCDAVARIANPKKYLIGGNNWYAEVFENNFETVMRDQKYELLRFWLLGSWMAEKLGKNFVLANLVRRKEETQIEHQFGRHIIQTERRKFVRWEWESLGPLLEKLKDSGSEDLLTYLEYKTIGFYEDKKRQLAKPRTAFSFV